MKRALLFPGQGSQAVGMGKALADAYPVAKETFREADDALGFALSTLCFEGPDAELKMTANTQPAILTTSIAAYRVIDSEVGVSFDFAAGHSLGEWSALVAVGALSLGDAVRLVNLRGRAMQEAVAPGVGAMAAILGLADDAVEAVCAEAAAGEVCQAANFNGGNQVVISGHAAAVERSTVLAKEKGAKRAMPLAVSAPFHSALMQPAADRMASALADTAFGSFSVPVISNVTAAPYQTADEAKELLVAQVTGSVRWQASVERLRKEGVAHAVELGHGAVLRGLCRRIDRELAVKCVGKPEDVSSVEK